MDLAENFVCQRQGEAQSAYYSRNQVTIHPMVITLKQQSGTPIRDSDVIVSNELKNDSTAVSQFVKVLDAHLSAMNPHIQRIVFWCDGCAA